jgi:hypothetical protein
MTLGECACGAIVKTTSKSKQGENRAFDRSQTTPLAGELLRSTMNTEATAGLHRDQHSDKEQRTKQKR